MYPGRWNTHESPIIYTAANFACAMLEILAGGLGRMPPNQHYIEIVIPNGTSYEVLAPEALPGWDHPDRAVSQHFGDTWCKSKRSALLYVPCLVARPERNILINPAHPEFRGIAAGLHQPIVWDRRLFGNG